MKAVVCVLIRLIFECVSCQNVINNPGFEDGLARSWVDSKASLELSKDDVYSGKYCIKLTYRSKSDTGLSQVISVKPGGYYTFKAFIKQLDGRHGNMGYNLFQTYKAHITYRWTDTGLTKSIDVAIRPFVQFGSGWLSLAGDHVVPTQNFTSSTIYIGGPETDVDFLVDDVSLEEVQENPTWQTEADASIESLRKSTVHVQVTHPPSYDPGDITIKAYEGRNTKIAFETGPMGPISKSDLRVTTVIDHKRHLFGFGCRVNQDYIVDPNYSKYQGIFYKMFNWATLDGFEWDRNEGTKDNPDYTNAVRAADELLSHGLVSSHLGLFKLETVSNCGVMPCSGVPGKTPHWVEKLNGPALKTAIKDRVNYITNLTGGKVSHWDVNNELLHGQLYEETTGDPNFSQSIYNMVHEADPSAKLFLNDFDVVATGAGTQKHLDDISSTNLSVWISQLAVINGGVSLRADWLSKLLRLYFSYPSVEGVTLSGFWNRDTAKNSSLVDGLQFHVNTAGQKYLDLIQNEWSTHVTYNLSEGPIHPVTGFHGDYDLSVYYQGKLIREQSFLLQKKDMMVKVTIDGRESEIQQTTTADPFSLNLHPTHQSVSVMSTLKSVANTTDLVCTTRWSELSEFGVVAETHIQCEDNEVLTGCSSLHKGSDWHRGGETIEMRSAKVSCSTKTIHSTLVGVYAIARCCKAPDISCNYWRTSLYPNPAEDLEMQVDCQPGYLATGCSTENSRGLIYDTFTSENNRSCLALKPKGIDGHFSGSCCRAPHLSCKKKMSTTNGLNKGDNSSITCDDGYTMTSCHADSSSAKTAGAFIEEDSDGEDQCVAVNGFDLSTGEEGAVAVAVCCKLDKVAVPVVG